MTKQEKNTIAGYAHAAKVEGAEEAYIYLMRVMYVLGIEPICGDEFPEVSTL